MSLILWVFIHILFGIALIFYYGKLPKGIFAFGIAFFIMSILYWGVFIANALFS